MENKQKYLNGVKKLVERKNNSDQDAMKMIEAIKKKKTTFAS